MFLLYLLYPEAWKEFMSQYCRDHSEEWVDMEATQIALQAISLGKRQRTGEEEAAVEEEGRTKKSRYLFLADYEYAYI